MKKIIALTLSVVTLTTGIVYSSASSSSGYSSLNEYELHNERTNDVQSILNDKITATLFSNEQGLLCAEDNSEVVEMDLATPQGFYLPYVSEISFYPATLAQRNPSSFELAGIVDETTIYTIYRRNDESIGDYYVYDFYTSCQGENAKPFKKDEDILLAVKSANEESQLQTPLNTDNLEAWNWGVAGLEIRVSKRLSSKDFEGISIGSTIEEVTSVDPITAISQPGKNDWWKDESYTLLKFDTFHYTDDGILKVSFEHKAIGEEFLVSDIELNKTFEVSYDGSSPVDGQPTVKLNINPEHLPD